MMVVMGGLLTGALFGFVLHRGGLTRYSRIMGTLLLRDLKAMKFMFTALAVASIGYGISGLADLELVVPRINPFLGWSHVVGGVIFGVGMGLSGF